MPLIEENIRVSNDDFGAKNTFGKEISSRTLSKYNKEFFLNRYKRAKMLKKLKKKKWQKKIKKKKQEWRAITRGRKKLLSK